MRSDVAIQLQYTISMNKSLINPQIALFCDGGRSSLRLVVLHKFTIFHVITQLNLYFWLVD